HLPDAGQALLVLAGGEISRFPCKELTHMLGSTTAPGRPGARAGAPCRIAFHSTHSVGVPRVLFSRLNTQPMRTPVNASPKPSRVSAHDSGTVGSLDLHWQRLALFTPCRSPGARIVNFTDPGRLF